MQSNKTHKPLRDGLRLCIVIRLGAMTCQVIRWEEKAEEVQWQKWETKQEEEEVYKTSKAWDKLKRLVDSDKL